MRLYHVGGELLLLLLPLVLLSRSSRGLQDAPARHPECLEGLVRSHHRSLVWVQHHGQLPIRFVYLHIIHG